VRGGKGDFIVTVDGKVVWNKKLSGSFPSYADLAPQLGGRPG
jgi:predicted Rdx family selenoprotein